MPTIDGSSGESSPCPSPSPTMTRLTAISPLPDLRRDSTCEESESVLNLPVPSEFADGSSRRCSKTQDEVVQIIAVPDANEAKNETAELDKQRTVSTNGALDVTQDDSLLFEQEFLDELENALFQEKNMPADYDDKECSSILSAISNEEVSIASDILDQKSFCPPKNADGEDLNGHIYHIDSPETDTADTYPNSEALHGESLMDDISSVLAMTGCDQDSADNTYTDDTTLFTNEMLGMKDEDSIAHRKKSFKSSEIKRRRSSKMKHDKLETSQYGFENRAFLQHILLEKDNRVDEKNIEPIKYCSLARFEEGSDIARISFKKKTKLSKTEANVNRQSTLSEELENIVNISFPLSTITLETNTFPQVSVIVEPPSPVLSEELRTERIEKIAREMPCNLFCDDKDRSSSEYDLSKTLREDYPSSKMDQLSIKSDRTSNSNHSSNSNLGIDNEQVNFLSCSPAATRRISSGSLLKPSEAAALAASASSLYADDRKDRREERDEKQDKSLPIINPLVRLPSWPREYLLFAIIIQIFNNASLSDVNGGSGLISKCLLANADALCAAVSPLMDPDETLLEGFFERCVMNNYFGIGIDAKISLDFHHKREEHPEKCRSRAKNYMWYGVLGSKQWLQKTYKNLDQRVQLECDGQRIPLPSLQGIVILNIPR